MQEVPPAIKAVIARIDPEQLYTGRRAGELIGLDVRGLETRRRKRQRPSYVTIGGNSRTIRYPGQELIDVLLQGSVECK
jgi:hypothetical protein